MFDDFKKAKKQIKNQTSSIFQIKDKKRQKYQASRDELLAQYCDEIVKITHLYTKDSDGKHGLGTIEAIAVLSQVIKSLIFSSDQTLDIEERRKRRATLMSVVNKVLSSSNKSNF